MHGRDFAGLGRAPVPLGGHGGIALDATARLMQSRKVQLRLRLAGLGGPTEMQRGPCVALLHAAAEVMHEPEIAFRRCAAGRRRALEPAPGVRIVSQLISNDGLVQLR